MHKNTKLALFIVLIPAAIAVLFVVHTVRESKTFKPEVITLYPNRDALVPAQLVDQDGRPYPTTKLKGKWDLLFFGYTHCPDICPMTLANLSRLVSRLQPQARLNLRVIFISIDPKRDTPAVLKKYVQFFDKRFIGVTGDDVQLMPFARSLGAIYFLGKADAEGNYTADHTSKIFLVDPQGRRAGIFSVRLEPPAQVVPYDALIHDLNGLLQ